MDVHMYIFYTVHNVYILNFKEDFHFILNSIHNFFFFFFILNRIEQTYFKLFLNIMRI